MLDGLRFLRPGFALTEDRDRAFALGWPEMRPSGGDDDDNNVQPLTRDHAIAYVRNIVPFGIAKAFDAVEEELFAIECAVGSDALADVMTCVLEEISPNEWKRANRNSFVPFYLLGFVLLRCEGALASSLRERLERRYANRIDDGGPLIMALDLVLHGAAGARRSAHKYGMSDANIDPAHALFIDDDVALVRAIVFGESFQKYDRRFAARLAFLGRDDPRVIEAVASRWHFAVASDEAQRSFVATVGAIASDVVRESIREAAPFSDVALDWCRLHDLAPAPRIAPPEREGDALVMCEGDEFGFVLLQSEDAELLRGEEDHTILAADADPTSAEPIAVAYGDGGDKRAVFVCLAAHIALVRARDGGVIAVMFGGDKDKVMDAFDAAVAKRAFAPLTKITLPSGKLVGLSASSTMADARSSGQVIAIELTPGTHDVLLARPFDDEIEGIWGLEMVWFRGQVS